MPRRAGGKVAGIRFHDGIFALPDTRRRLPARPAVNQTQIELVVVIAASAVTFVQIVPQVVRLLRIRRIEGMSPAWAASGHHHAAHPSRTRAPAR